MIDPNNLPPTMKQDSNPTTNHPTLPTVCGQCGVEERKFLHNVRHRSNFRRLCTSCVLRLHPQCFCPACLGVYDRSPPIDAVVCYKCYSASHPACVSPPPAGTITSARCSSPCASCVNPNLLVFNLNRVENRNGGRPVYRIDSNAARLLLAAAKIAAMSMNKAEAAAAMEAERRAKEAAYNKKRAREALDHVVMLMAKEKGNKKVSNVNTAVVAAAAAAAAPLAAVAATVTATAVDCKDDASNEVLEALNAVELKENGPGVLVENGVAQGNTVAVMEVDGVKGEDSVVDPVSGNGIVKNDDLVKVVHHDQEH